MSHPPGPGDALGRWLLGGLAAGAVALGLMVAGYAVGYHRGQDSARGSAAPATTAAATTTTTAAAPATPTQSGPALVARGKELFQTGCSACHSLGAEAGVGPGLGGLAGHTVTLDDGTKVIADDAYLARSLTDADAQVVKGYRAGIMPAAVAPLHLDQRPADVAALVAFIKQQS